MKRIARSTAATGTIAAGARRLRSRPRLMVIAAAVTWSVACGYGFGNHQFRDMKSTAVAFALALQANDTSRMRQLGWGVVRDSIGQIRREIPPAYSSFAAPTPELVTIKGGGIYGGTGTAEFLAVSTQLTSCRGGVQLLVLMLDNKPRVGSVRLVPAPDSVTDDGCRSAIRDSAGSRTAG